MLVALEQDLHIMSGAGILRHDRADPVRDAVAHELVDGDFDAVTGADVFVAHAAPAVSAWGRRASAHALKASIWQREHGRISPSMMLFTLPLLSQHPHLIFCVVMQPPRHRELRRSFSHRLRSQ